MIYFYIVIIISYCMFNRWKTKCNNLRSAFFA